jgi:hypothetical protein
MTTFQDPPPQSRRSARQNERGDQPADTGNFGQYPAQAPVQPAQPGQYPAQSAPPATGRRARPVAGQEPYEVPPEPLNYSTQGRQPASPSPASDASQTPGYAPSPAEPAPFRVRDFSPEGGRRAAAPPLVEPNAYAGNVPGATDLDYRTQGVAGGYVQPAPSADPAGHQTLSRRELRQRQAEEQAAATATQAPGQYAPAQYPGQPPVQYAAQPAPAQYPAQAAPVQYPGQPAQYPGQQSAPPPPPVSRAPHPDQPGQPTALSNARAEFEALSRTGQGVPQAATQAPVYPQPVMPPEVEQTGGRVVPTGHWSRQADLDDETQPWENTITREVGGGNVATTTSALVLPQIPRADPFATALNSTGEVLLTGSIDLPRSLGSSGGDSRHYDDPRVDHMFDTQDAEFTGTDSSPVRAIRAVSTQTANRGVIHANKPHGNRLIVLVFVATAVLAVGVVAMLVASLAFDLF